RPCELHRRARKQNENVQRKHELAIEILVQAVVIAGTVGEEERRRLTLPCLVTAREIRLVLARIARRLALNRAPGIRNVRQWGIERRTQGGDEVGQRIGKIFVLAAAETAASHDDTAAE